MVAPTLEALQPTPEPAIELTPQNVILFGTAIQRSASEAHDLGLSPFPLPYGKKEPTFDGSQYGFKWQRYAYTRLPSPHGKLGRDFRKVFQGRCNIGIALGMASGNAFVVDVDEMAFAKLIQLTLEKHDIPPYMVETGKGVHFYLRTDATVGNGTFAGGDILGQNKYALYAGSKHPEGRFYATSPDSSPTIPYVEFERLQDILAGINIPIEQYKKAYAPQLTLETKHYLNHGANEGERNLQLFRASRDVHYCEQWKLIGDLRSHAYNDGLEPPEINRTLQQGKKYALLAKQKTISRPVQNAIGFVANATYEKPEHKRVLAGLVSRYRDDSTKGGFRASIRELAKRTGLSTVMVQKTVDMFLEAKLITYTGKSLANANVYRFDTKVTAHAPLEADNRLDIWLHALWDKNALGAHTGQVYWYLLEQTTHTNIPAIAREANIKRSTVYKALDRLQSHKLIMVSDVGIEAVNYPNILDVLNTVAMKFDCTDRREKRAQRFDEETGIHIAGYAILHREKFDTVNYEHLPSENTIGKCHPITQYKLPVKAGSPTVLPSDTPSNSRYENTQDKKKEATRDAPEQACQYIEAGSRNYSLNPKGVHHETELESSSTPTSKALHNSEHADRNHRRNHGVLWDTDTTQSDMGTPIATI